MAMSVTPSRGETRPPVPPFTLETAAWKVRLAEDAWNSRDPEHVALAYTPGFPLAKPRGIRQRQAGDHRLPDPQVGARARVPPDQGAVGVRRTSHRRALRVRMA